MSEVITVRTLRKAKVQRIIDYTPEFRELFIECVWPESFQFKAGQFVMLQVPNKEDPQAKPLQRAYSVASSDQISSGYRLVFKAVPGGAATRYVWSLNEGSEIQFTGPFGRVLFKEPPTEQLVFLNTGSGISQHFSFIESNIQKYPDLRYRILFGLRFESDLYYQAELERLKKMGSDLEYQYVISRPTPSWKGLKGYVQNHIEPLDYVGRSTTFYLCGNGAMIKDVKELLKTQSFDMTRVFAEAFD